MTFEAWMEDVNDKFIAVTGLDRDSWPDSMYWDHWEDGYTPIEAVALAIKEEYGYEGLEQFGLDSAM